MGQEDDNKTKIEVMKNNCKNMTDRIFEKLEEISKKQIEIKEAIDKTNDDHEERLRNLEKDKKGITAIASSISTFLGIICYAIYQELKK